MARDILIPGWSGDEPRLDDERSEAFMGNWFESPGTPETAMQALMETAPGESPITSREEIQALREAVADCQLVLSQKQRFVLDAKESERLSNAKLGKRMGFSKTQAQREHKTALAYLGHYLKAHPVITERFPMLQPTTWDEAAENAVRYIHVTSVTTLAAPFDLCIERGTDLLDEPERNAGAITDILVSMGATSFTALNADDDEELVEECVQLLIDRHHKYGPNNILGFRQLGLLVRMSDKVARIKNGQADFADETYRDAYLDIIGYAAIAHMLDQNTFELELES